MSLSIRLARAGAHKKPFYRVVVADKRMPRDGRFIEKIGTYDPLLVDKRQRVRLSTERAQHWMALGAKPSRRVALFLYEAGVGEKPAIPQQTKKSLPRKKELERRAAEQLKSQQLALKEAKPEETKIEEGAPEEEKIEEAKAEEEKSQPFEEKSQPEEEKSQPEEAKPEST